MQTTQSLATVAFTMGISEEDASNEQTLLLSALQAYRALPWRGRIEIWKRPNEKPDVSIIHRDSVSLKSS